ncbi:hypothetical protein [Streptomyces celluloflavus]|uniref:hypothetical protein n=1 Tax=Streptomyces celluloflavus TaxID=58344 RepID=UPI0036C2EF5C
MSTEQRHAARRLRGLLAAAGVEVSISQVATRFDAVMEWHRGARPLDGLCRDAGWDAPDTAPDTDGAPAPGPALQQAVDGALARARKDRPAPGTLDRVRAAAADVAILRTALADTVADLRADITTADRTAAGDPGDRERLVAAAADGLSRRLVFQHLGAEDVLARARAVLDSCRADDDPRYVPHLTRTTSGAVRLHLEVDALAHLGGLDDLQEAEYAERLDIAEQEASVGGRNLLGGVLYELDSAGLAVETEGRHDQRVTDMYNGATATLTLKSAR